MDPDPQHVKPLALGSAWKMRTRIREAKYHFKKLPHLYILTKKVAQDGRDQGYKPNQLVFRFKYYRYLKQVFLLDKIISFFIFGKVCRIRNDPLFGKPFVSESRWSPM